MCNCNQTINTNCGCTSQTSVTNICQQSCPPTECDCPVRISTDCSTYTGDDLECTGVLQNTVLTEVIQQMDAYICQAISDLNASINIVNIGDGAEVYKGIDGIGRRELRSITKTGDLITVTENTNDIAISIDEEALIEFIDGNQAENIVFLRTVDSTPITSTLKVISDNLNNESTLRLSTEDITSRGAGDIATNTAYGEDALTSNTTGNKITAFGFEALKANTTGTESVAIGDSALSKATTAFGNTAIGNVALKETTTGSRNTAIGALTLSDNTTGENNTAIGLQALADNTTGARNNAIGVGALNQNTTGNDNVSIGGDSMSDNSTGSKNVAIGTEALKHSTGSGNIAIGYQAAQANITGIDNTILGEATVTGDFSGSVILGKGATSTGDNQFVTGSPLYNSGVITNEVVSSTKTWTIVVNGVKLKVLVVDAEAIVEEGAFGYHLSTALSACTDACNMTSLVNVYRDALDNNFSLATQLATDLAMTIPATAGYYAEFDTTFGDSIVRYWDGSNFIGAPTVCGC